MRTYFLRLIAASRVNWPVKVPAQRAENHFTGNKTGRMQIVVINRANVAPLSRKDRSR